MTRRLPYKTFADQGGEIVTTYGNNFLHGKASVVDSQIVALRIDAESLGFGESIATCVIKDDPISPTISGPVPTRRWAKLPISAESVPIK